MFRNLRTHYQANANYKELPLRCKPDELAAHSCTGLRASLEAPRIGAKLRFARAAVLTTQRACRARRNIAFC
jgi:hypothetical protein